MNKKFLVSIISVLMMCAVKSQAQGIVFVTEDAPKSHPEVLIHVPAEAQDNVIIQDASFTEDIVSPKEMDEVKNKNISYYVQKLNLSSEQISRAQEISRDSHAKQEQILKSIEDLRVQAHELENKSLADFVAILTDEQKAEFDRLQNDQGTTNDQAVEATTEAQSEEMPSEPQPEETTNSQSEEMPSEPQPEEI